MPNASLNADQVASLAEHYLEKHQPANYRINVVRDGISVDELGWWDVPVQISRDDVPSYDWIARTAEAAVDMDEAEGVHVLFI